MVKKGFKHSEDAKKRMSESSKGKPSSFKGKKHSASANRKNRLAHLGKKHSDETLRRMREAAKRRKKPTKETGRKISNALKGKKKSRKHRESLSKSAKGRVITKETRKKISQKNSGKGNAMFGKHHSESSKRKNRRSHLGKKATKATTIKQSKAHKGKQTGKDNPMFGKHQSDKSKRKRRKTMKKKYPGGIKLSEEHKEKIAKKYKPQKPSKNTKIEKVIQKLLRKQKIRFRTQKRFEFEKPPPHFHSVDLFIEPNICIECDGDRFHANPKTYSPNDIIYKAYKSKNHNRKEPLRAKQIWSQDKHITQELRKQGNRVIRFWGSEINSNPEKCLQRILKKIQKR